MGLLSGKNGIIVGASQGIGLGIAKKFVEEGGSIIMTARGKDKLEAASAEVNALGAEGKAIAMVADAVSSEDAAKVFNACVAVSDDTLPLAPVLHVVDPVLCQERALHRKGAVDGQIHGHVEPVLEIAQALGDKVAHDLIGGIGDVMERLHVYIVQIRQQGKGGKDL